MDGRTMSGARRSVAGRALNRVLRPVRAARRRAALRRRFPADEVHFIHIGKTAGTKIAHIARQVNENPDGRRIRFHGHAAELGILPEACGYFFAIRDPISRFRSGFYSRKRKGQPRYNVEWSPYEAFAFERFEHANDLAEALFEDGPRGRDAAAAIKSIQHTAQNQSDHFTGQGAFIHTRPPVWIVRQQKFAEDMREFLTRIGHGALVDALPLTQPVHGNDYSGIPDLSADARARLQAWYAQDFAFIALCEAWIAEQPRASHAGART
jgi:hypothetical protein